jgi:hypothetical protein
LWKWQDGEIAWIIKIVTGTYFDVIMNRRTGTNLFLSSIFLSMYFASGVATNSALANPVKYNYQIDQFAQAGPHHIHITDQGMVVEAPKSGAFFQYSTTQKLITMWSVKQHVYCTLPYQKWITSFRNLYAAVGWYSELTKPVKSTTKRKGNLTYHVYQYRIDAQSPSYWRSDIGHKEAAEGLQDVELTTLDLPVFDEAGPIMERIYGMPRLSGFPYSVLRPAMSTLSLSTTKLVAAAADPLVFFKPTAADKKMPFSNQIFGPNFDENLTKIMLP